MFKIPKELQQLAKILPNSIYIVGGFVRDSLQKISSTDIDLCSNLTVEDLTKNLQNTNFEVVPNSLQFGTAKIKCNNLTFEYSTFRKDFYATNGKHSPKKVEFVLSLEEDCLRRDFTVNAIYYDIKNNKIIDPLNGKTDLENRLLKAVPPADETLSIDGERLLRLAKFKAKMGFIVEDNTLNAAKKYSGNIFQLSKNTIEKFLKSIAYFTKEQLKEIKIFLEELNCHQIANYIKED